MTFLSDLRAFFHRPKPPVLHEPPPRKAKEETPWQRYQRQRSNIVRLLHDLEKQHDGQGRKWVAKMRAYYTHRLELLDAARPARDPD